MTVLESQAVPEPAAAAGSGRRPMVVHVTTTDMSLDWLLKPQLLAFADAGYEVVGVSAPGPHVEDLVASGIRHIPTRHLTRAMSPGHDVAAGFELRRIFSLLAPDIVHTHNPKPGVLGRIAARAAGVPVVINTVHGLYAQPEDRWLRRTLVYSAERNASRFADLELVQNPEDVETLQRLGIPVEKIELLGNGVDLHRFRPDRLARNEVADRRAALGIKPDEIVCGLVGRLVNEKGYREVLDAAHTLAAAGQGGSENRVRFVIVGPSEPDKADAVAPELLARAEADGVIFLGQRDDVDDLYALFDFYCLASYREGFPRSAMEAAACGLPLIVTDIRGGRQVVDDGLTGFLVPARERTPLVDRIARLAGDDTGRRRMAVASLAKARAEFDHQRQIDVTLAAYDRLATSVR